MPCVCVKSFPAIIPVSAGVVREVIAQRDDGSQEAHVRIFDLAGVVHWNIICEDSITSGDKVRVKDVIGNRLLTTKTN